MGAERSQTQVQSNIFCIQVCATFVSVKRSTAYVLTVDFCRVYVTKLNILSMAFP